MSAPIAKTYDPASMEASIYKAWLDAGCFTADPAAPGQPYCIVIPPPNVTGALHLGHAINNTLQDILTRVHRMRGFNALWVPGIDHAGIATQAVVEKQLKEIENRTRHDVGRDGLVERIWKWKEQYGNRILEQLKRLGCSCDWTRTRFTLDEMCAAAVRETFFKLFKDGLIYRGKRLVNWDVHLQTSISDDEIYHETVKTFLWHIRYPIVDSDRAMTIATTRPETLLGDTAVAVHSQDERWNWAIGKFVDLPLTGRKIPIIADDILVDPTFGSGVVKVTPAHDPNDYAVWQRHQGKADQIDLLNILNPDGTLNDNAGAYKGMKRDVARKKVIEDLTSAGLLEKEEPYETQVGHSDRSKTAVEPYLSDQWFVHMAPLAEPALQVVRDGKISFHPERHSQQYLAWLGEKRDWPISRQLWWGHRIPVWHNVSPTPDALQSLRQNQDILHVAETETGAFICLRKEEIEIESRLSSFGFVQDPDVLDTWFSSALWPHSTLGWPQKTADLAKWYPTSVLLTDRGIITLWVARMVMTGLYNMGDIPFRHVVINPTILDGKGERMSKSKGNGVDPVDVIETHGADALRFTMTQMATETQDVRIPVRKDASGRNTSEKFDAGSRFCNKIWQVAQFFVIANLEKISPEPDDAKASLVDQWIIARLHRAVAEADAALEHFRFDQYAKICYEFVYEDFCSWYVEAAKLALRGESAGQTAAVLAAVLDGSMRLLHPIIPFITETIWQRLNEVCHSRGLPQFPCPPSRWLIKAAWPKAPQTLGSPAEATFAEAQLIVTAIRNLRNEYKIEPRKRLSISLRFAAADNSGAAEITPLIEHLAGCDVSLLSGTDDSPADAARVQAGRCEIFAADLVDQDAEQQRVGKRRDELNKLVQTLRGRLSNESYIARAPSHLVAQTKDQLADAESELAKLS